MLHFEHQKLLKYSPQQMFDLIMDIEKYPSFLPWCTKAIIIEHNIDYLLADLVISFGLLSQTYRSKVVSIKNNDSFVIKINSKTAVFDYLNSSWDILKQGSMTKVVFKIDISFKSSMLQNLASLFIEEVSSKIILRYERRAEEIYGKII